MTSIHLAGMTVDSKGEGPAIVMLHGLGGTSNSFQAMIGPRGLLLVRARNETLQGKVAELDKLKAQHQDLESRARLLRNDHLSADLLDERARYVLGVADPRDYVIRTKP